MDALNQLMQARRMPGAPVAFGRNRLFTWRDLQGHVAGLSEQLAGHPPGRWLLISSSTYAFSVGLLALWQTGRIAVLPPNPQADSLRETLKGIHGIVTDASLPAGRIPKISPLSMFGKAPQWKSLNSRRTCLELFTSGSTGERKAILKNLSMLESEIAVLENTFGRRLAFSSVSSTVSHQHIYGLLFRLLWPISAGRPFADAMMSFWEDYNPSLSPGGRICVVSSPAHLERISVSGQKALKAFRPRLIFSSGGPLSDSAAAFVREKCRTPLVEVFGSTETGGVGWRERTRTAGSQEWTPLKRVKVSVKDPQESSPFYVSSPFVSAPHGSFRMGDRGTILKNGKFLLQGRMDRVVKIAEKRLSLDDMERRLSRHRWIREAKVILLHTDGRVARQMLGAAIMLRPGGRSWLRRAGRVVVVSNFKEYLQKSFETSMLPRSFRFVESFPSNSQGKVSHAGLAALFQARSEISVTTPQQLSLSKTTSHLRVRFRVPEGLAYLEGHFPNYPVVPGIVQLRWVVDAATQWLGRRFTIQRMEAIKFKNLLLPGHGFSLVLEKESSGSAPVLRFSLADHKRLYSSGRLVPA